MLLRTFQVGLVQHLDKSVEGSRFGPGNVSNYSPQAPRKVADRASAETSNPEGPASPQADVREDLRKIPKRPATDSSPQRGTVRDEMISRSGTGGPVGVQVTFSPIGRSADTCDTMPIENIVEKISLGPEMRGIVKNNSFLDPGCLGARQTEINQSIANLGRRRLRERL